MDCLTAAIGLLKLLNVQNLHLASSLDYSATHMCVFTVHSSNRSPNPQLSSSATHMCMCLQQQSVCQSFLNGQSFKWLALHQTCVFRNTHVYAHKQQLVGQPLTLECNPQWTASETHMCVCSQQQLVCWSCWMFRTFTWLVDWTLLQNRCLCVHSSNWSAHPQLTSSATHVCLCSQQQSVSFNWLVLHQTCVYSATHVCMPTAAVGWPILDPWLSPSATHVCMCLQA